VIDDIDEPKFLPSLRDMAAHDLGVTIGREQLRELLAYIDELEGAYESMWNSLVESSERD
jgi:hypothetical protein